MSAQVEIDRLNLALGSDEIPCEEGCKYGRGAAEWYMNQHGCYVHLFCTECYVECIRWESAHGDVVLKCIMCDQRGTFTEQITARGRLKP